MSPHLYDMLDVPEDASADAIRAAWKAAIADLDPTDRRFRAFNEAAGTLLDEEKRAAYDAELAASREEADDAPDAEVEGAEVEDAEVERDPEEGGAEVEDGDAEVEEAEAEVEEGRLAAGHETAPPGRFADDPPQWALGAAGVLAVIALALAVWVATWPGTFGDPSPQEREDLRQDATSSVAAGEEIAQVVLSYGYQDLDAQLAQAQDLMTSGYADEWAAVLDNLRPEVEAQKTTVTAAVRASAISDLSDDGEQAEVMVLVDQLVQKDGETETELQLWATLRMIRDDGTWLLEKICTTDPECA